MHIVIVGGGFAGIKTALELNKDPSLDITLISDKDHFVFYPALYDTATGGSHLESIITLRNIFEKTRVKVVQDTITQYDPIRKIVSGKKAYHYDYVVFALGVVTSYFGISGLDTYSYSIKSYSEVKRFKSHLHNLLIEDRHMDKHYIVAGAGPTGVELSAALVKYLRKIGRRHGIKNARISINLVEAAPRVLPRMSEKASEKAKRRLRDIGVIVRTNKKVESQDDDSIIISSRDVPTETVIWTSGVSNHPFFAQHSGHFTLAQNGRVEVDEHLMSEPRTYVIGDNAATQFTGMAQTALHNAHFAAKDIKRLAHKLPRPAYKPSKPITVVPIGENWAILEWHAVILTGFIGSAIRRAADFIGYYDILPLAKAFKVWRAQHKYEEECEICNKS